MGDIDGFKLFLALSARSRCLRDTEQVLCGSKCLNLKPFSWVLLTIREVPHHPSQHSVFLSQICLLPRNAAPPLSQQVYYDAKLTIYALHIHYQPRNMQGQYSVPRLL
jgi:hypothetical protein